MTALEEWFLSLGIEKVIAEQTVQLLKAEDILSVEDALKLSDNELKDLGIKLGTRKKILEGSKLFHPWNLISEVERANKDSPATSSHSFNFHPPATNFDNLLSPNVEGESTRGVRVKWLRR